jgi:hypothetical protein
MLLKNGISTRVVPLVFNTNRKPHPESENARGAEFCGDAVEKSHSDLYKTSAAVSNFLGSS